MRIPQSNHVAAEALDERQLEFTILRPGWFTQAPAGPYQVTPKGTAFQGHDISLVSLTSLIVKIATTPGLYVRASIGVNDS